ncbi:MAG TPA: DUF1289 domain-containing protein [Stellaceae bacterium]|jgi:hypothetical protein|nr:DUF1289 domain-containing protein [Stellaceae bacterium]
MPPANPTALPAGTIFEANPISPCLGICLMDPRTRTCRGCSRTIEEIAGWYTAVPAEKRAILTRLAERRAALDGKTAGTGQVDGER